ncbi:profilin family protein [Streptomyces sp. NPDC091209]|uniref:profilin family protein n=1 Tax=Streptomyces sp. NPDC091209 TaxID=3365974 RepID=UPI00382743B7
MRYEAAIGVPRLHRGLPTSSWQAYADSLMSTGVVERAAIYDDQGTLAGASPDFALKAMSSKLCARRSRNRRSPSRTGLLQGWVTG